MRISGRPIKIRPEVAAAYRSNGTLWERLKAACPAEWERYLQNDFIWHLADGSLSREAYRHFIVQDCFYLNSPRAWVHPGRLQITVCRGHAQVPIDGQQYVGWRDEEGAIS